MSENKLIALQENHAELVRKQEALMDRAQEIVDGKERGFTPEDEKEFDRLSKERKDVLAKIDREQKFEEVRAAKILSEKPQAPAIHDRKSDHNIYSEARAIQAAVTRNWEKAGKELETMQEISRGHNKPFDKNMVYLDPFQSRADLTRAVSIVGTAADGGNLVGTEYRGDKLVNPLWNASILSKLPVVNNTGMVGFQTIPVLSSKATATMVGEQDALPTAEKVTTSILTATPKEMVTKSSYSRQLAIQGTPRIASIVTDQVYKAIADKLDSMAVNGSTTAPSIGGWLQISGTTTVSANAAGTALSYSNLVKMYTELGKLNVSGDLYFITNNQVIGTAMTTLKDTANTNSGYILTDMNKNLLNMPTVISQNVPGNLQTSTTRSAILLGDFSETEVFQWDTIAVEFDYTTGADNSQVTIRSYSFWDIINKRPANFAKITDVITI